MTGINNITTVIKGDHHRDQLGSPQQSIGIITGINNDESESTLGSLRITIRIQ
jgi:hypothetical protein